MSFNGNLLSLGGTQFPLNYIYKESYTITPNRRLDLDSTRTTTGVLNRNVLSHTATTISFQTKPLDNEEMAEMWSFIRNAYTDEDAKKVRVVYYSPELDSYESGTFYIPDVEFPIYSVDTDNSTILYKSQTIELIEY